MPFQMHKKEIPSHTRNPLYVRMQGEVSATSCKSIDSFVSRKSSSVHTSVVPGTCGSGLWGAVPDTELMLNAGQPVTTNATAQRLRRCARIDLMQGRGRERSGVSCTGLRRATRLSQALGNKFVPGKPAYPHALKSRIHEAMPGTSHAYGVADESSSSLNVRTQNSVM